MKQPCELVVARFLPTLRGITVRTLLAEYGLRQAAVAKAMGLTQAAVSHYHHAARGSDPELEREFPELVAYARALARQIANGASESAQVAMICEACEEIRAGESFCRFHAAENGVAHGSCDACAAPPSGFVAFPSLARPA